MGGVSQRYRCANITGNQSEQIALTYFNQQRLQLIAKNFRAKVGEIDLVMHDQHTLIFIEVRYRRTQQFGGALASVNWQKQQRIIRAAQWFLQQYPRWAHLPCRFDVITLSGKINTPQIEWIKNAFQIEE